jgi:hypothetical protein
MRKIITILSIAAFLLSFTVEGQVKKKKNKAQTVQTDKKPSGAKNTPSLKGKKGKKMIAHPIDIESSSIQWTGKKMIGASHQGVLSFKSGELVFSKEGKLKGGSLAVDMSSLRVLDLTDSRRNKLEEHLKSGDFFSVKEYPLATLLMKQVTEINNKSYEIQADMTIKGTTKPIVFVLIPAIAQRSFQTALTIDRTAYGVNFAAESFSNYLGDKAIDKFFSLNVTLIY